MIYFYYFFIIKKIKIYIFNFFLNNYNNFDIFIFYFTI
jgi:hypothetical protein